MWALSSWPALLEKHVCFVHPNSIMQPTGSSMFQMLQGALRSHGPSFHQLFPIILLMMCASLTNPQAFSQTEGNPTAKEKIAKTENSQDRPPSPTTHAPSKREKDAAAKPGNAKERKAKSIPQSDPPPSNAATQKRLDTIERKLDKLTEQVGTIVKVMERQQAGTGREAGETKQESNGTKKPIGIQVNPKWLKNVPWRSIGPANMGGRITDLEVHPQDPSLFWVATASGGLLKTENRGITVQHQFDRENTVSIGAIASDPQDKNILWVGTGEINPRNSVSYGDGIYKSTDGGKSWKQLGLDETYQISRILVHPKDSDVVYVGAQGRLYGPSDERGVYKTSDGGKTWKKVLYLDERTGVIDMIMHPEDPDTLIAAMWDRQRDGFDSWPGKVPKPEGVDGYDPIRKWGPTGGLYKTTDGGKNWEKLTQGLPTSWTGRIGLDWQKSGSHTIYAIVDCQDIGKGPKPFPAYLGLVGRDSDNKAEITQVAPKSPASEAGVQVGDVLVDVEGKEIERFDELLDALREKMVGDRFRFAVRRGEETLDVSVKLGARPGTRTNTPAVYLGLSGKDEEGQIVLTSVADDGPAKNAGLKIGDVVVQSDGKKFEKYTQWITASQKKAIGDPIKLLVQREDEEIEIEITLSARPSSSTSSAFMGIQGQDAPKTSGALLTIITADGPSAKAGLKANDVVTQVGKNKISNYNELIAEIRARQPDDEMPVRIQRGGKTIQLTVILGDRNAGNSERPYTYSYFGQRPNVQDQQGSDGHLYGGVYKSLDAGETWERVNSLNVRPMYFSVIRVDPSDDQRVYLLGVSQFQSDNGGITFSSDFGRGVHSDSHDLWIDPQDGRHMILGGDGGFYETYDRGRNWDHINTAAIAQFYHVTIAPKQPYWVYGGLQDNGSWGGPAISKSGGTLNEDWISVGGGDGFVCRADPDDPDLVYTESQNGSIRRRNLRTGSGASIRPPRKEGIDYRFNWNTPFILSNHNSKIFYSAGNYVFRSLDRGDDLKIISPEITATERGSATALSESPINPDVLYVGTDDGALWCTQDGGNTWKNITKNLGIDPKWVATIEASHFEAGRVYVCLDAHRSDDDRPYALISEDYGETFELLSRDLPRGSSRCLREDILNPNLLYLGTEFSLWVSLDRGENWTQFNQTLPTVAVHEIAMHSSVNEIVAATHGRSLWACDVSALRLLTPDRLSKTSLLPPGDIIRWRRTPSRGRTNRRFVGQNPGRNAKLWYSLTEDAKGALLSIQNIQGEVLAKLKVSAQAGLHAIEWNLTQTENLGRGRPRPVADGDYRVVLSVDGKETDSQTIAIKQDPTLAKDSVSSEEFSENTRLWEQPNEESEEADKPTRLLEIDEFK